MRILGVIFFVLLFMTNVSWGFDFLKPHQKGKGQLTLTNAYRTTYQVQLSTVKSSLNPLIMSIETLYTSPSNGIKRWNFLIKETGPKQYQILFQGFVVGQGHCLLAIPLCHYELPHSREKLEETFYSYKGILYRYGSKWVNNQKQTWFETYN